MQFDSMDFLIFFPFAAIGLYLVPRKLRALWLLAASYVFYMYNEPRYGALLAAVTLWTWSMGLLLEKETRHKKLILIVSLVVTYSSLIYYKYTGFFASVLGLRFDMKLILPLGISFFIFQSAGYLLDVNKKKIHAERNLIDYALYIAFFPKLISGPLENSANFLPQIHSLSNRKLLDLDAIRDGILLIFWGLFQKLVIAERAAMAVNAVYNDYQNSGGFEILCASVLYTIQIYCDFGGYTAISRGTARVLGFELRQNFRQPYLAVGIKEFWHRWHISLTGWFTEYVYIPLGGSRQGRLRKYMNILIVFFISGLWHGANWNFAAWGLLHAVYQIIEDIYKGPRLPKRLRRLLTFAEVNFAWIFFSAGGFNRALRIIRQGFRPSAETFPTFAPGHWFVLFGGLLILFCVDMLHEKGYVIFSELTDKPFLRWSLSLGLIWAVIMLGIYGVGYDTSNFIYFRF